MRRPEEEGAIITQRPTVDEITRALMGPEEYDIGRLELAGYAFNLMDKLIYEYTSPIMVYYDKTLPVKASVYLEPGVHDTPLVAITPNISAQVSGEYEEPKVENSRRPVLKEGKLIIVVAGKGVAEVVVERSNDEEQRDHLLVQSDSGFDELETAGVVLGVLEKRYQSNTDLTRNHDLMGEALFRFSEIEKTLRRAELIEVLAKRGIDPAEVGISEEDIERNRLEVEALMQSPDSTTHSDS